MNIILSAILMAVIIYLLPLIAFVFTVVFSIIIYLLSLIALILIGIFSIVIEPIKIMNRTWCTIMDYIKKYISKKREDKDISNLEL